MTDEIGSDAADEPASSSPWLAEPPTPTPGPSSAQPVSEWERAAPTNRSAGPAPGYGYVGFWRRALALFIDSVLLAIVSWAILIPMLLSSFSSVDWRALAYPEGYVIDPATGIATLTPAAQVALGHFISQMYAGLGLILLVQAIYFIVFWTWRGATLGQMALGVQVRNEVDGRRIGLGRSVLRYIGFTISSWVLLIGFFWAAFDKRKQGWHDKIGGTVVIRRTGG